MAFVPHRAPRVLPKEIEQGKYGDDGSLPGNRFLELKALRPSQRIHAIKNKLIADPENRTDLTGAITVVGTCLDMCPEFERHEREYQKDVDEWEKIPDTNPKRIDHMRAVKKYRRSAAGNEDPLPSDLRPPHILKKTLDYLLEDLLPTHGLAATYAFIRDRTRAIRTDFVIQHIKGPSAIECFERIARFHILAVHAFCEGEGVAGEDKEEIRGFDYWLEVEQMMKTLQSLIQFYDDRPMNDPQPPNEAEFRAYYLLAHIRSNSILRRLHTLAPFIFLSPIMQSALEFRAYAQSLSVSATNAQGGAASGSTHKSRTKALAATPPLQNFFTRFFKRIEDPSTSYLLACLLEYHFGGIRKGAIHALWKAYSTRHRGIPIRDAGRMLGFLNLNGARTPTEDIRTEEVLKKFGMRIEFDTEDGEKRVVLNRLSTFDHAAQITQRHSSNLVEPKRGRLSDVEIVNGNFEKAERTWKGLVQTIPPILTAHYAATPTALPTPTPTPIPTTSQGHSSLFIPSMSANSVRSNGMSMNQFPRVVSAGLVPQKSAPFGGNIAPAFTFKRMGSVPAYVPSTSAFISPPSTSVQPHVTQPIANEIIPSGTEEEQGRQRQRQIAAQKEQEDKIRAEEYERQLRTEMKERRLKLIEKEKKQVEEEIQLKEQEEQRRLEEAERERRREEERMRKEEEEQERQRIEREHQEQLKRQRRERTRTADLRFLSRVFDRWKRVVIKKGEVRRAFRKSIMEMGMGAGPSEERTIVRSPKNLDVEDLISWEDMSEFSVPGSYLSGLRRRQRSKGKKRMDDEVILTAIKEAEKKRLALWERGTFLRFVKEICCRGDVWLSIYPQSMSTREWLRIKFDVQTTIEDDVLPILHGDRHGPGLIIIDTIPSDDESLIQQDILRIRNIFSRLPSDRHYIPSVLILQWTGSEKLPTSISTEMDTLLEKGTVLDVRILVFSEDDLNDQFKNALTDISFDDVGKLVKKMSLEDIFAILLDIWDTKLSQELERCQLGDTSHSFDWPLYGQVIETLINLLQTLAEQMAKTCQIDMISESWPKFDGSGITDDHSAFETFIHYIEFSWLAFEEPAIILKTELIADMDQNREFETQHVPSRIARLVLFKFQALTSPDRRFYLHAHEQLPNAIELSEVIRSTLLITHENTASRKNFKKRIASDESHLNGSSSVKRYKQDGTSGLVNGHGSSAVGSIKVNQKERPSGKAPDVLNKLKSSILKAKQSVEDLRASRESAFDSASLRSNSPLPPSGDSLNWTSLERSSFLFDKTRLYDDLNAITPYSGRNHARSSLDGSLLHTPPKGSFTSRPFSATPNGYGSQTPSAKLSTSLPKSAARNSDDTKDSLTDMIERARKSIREARKLRHDDTSIK